jgi:5,10-methylenetetrahydromethanopterin reductase
MEIGCLFPPTMDTHEHIRLAEELGYTRAYVYDSPAFLADAWMVLARAAEVTEEITIGVSVITPKLRHLISNTGSVATLSTLAPGRVEVVVGSGFTSQLMLGKPPARWSEVEEYVNAMRALLSGEDIEWDGATIGLRYGELCGVQPEPVKIRMAAHGPKGYAAAARSADGIVTNLAHHSQNTGIDDMSTVLVLYYGTVFGEDEPLDSDRIIDATGPCAAFQLHIGGEGVAAGTAEFREYQAALDAIPADRRHLETHRGHLIEVTDLERPLITPELIKQATGSGTAGEVRANLDGLEQAGIQGVLYGPMGPDIPRELEAFAEVAGVRARSFQ